MSPDATPQKPIYSKQQQEGQGMFMITCDEGWRTSIVCTDMYEWAADWLLGVLGNRPFAPEARP
jgi:hypothetical protein